MCAQLELLAYVGTYVVLEKVEVVEAYGPAEEDGDAPEEEDALEPLLLLVDEDLIYDDVAIEQSLAIL